MVRQRKEEKIEPVLPPGKSIELLQKQISQIDNLLTQKYDAPEVMAWENFTEQVIIKAFGKPHGNLQAYFSAKNCAGLRWPMPEQEIQRNYVNNLNTIRKLLEGFIEQIQNFRGVEKPKIPSDIPLSKKIFIVHGHNEQAKNDLTLILMRFGLEPVILHEKPSQGMTLIEKLEKHSDVGFAFVILTPDDVGCSKNELKEVPTITTLIETSEEKHYKDVFKARARQNVVFEFGLFVGKLGRNRVCCLHTGDVDLPSDLAGLVYIPLKSSVNDVSLDIAKELQAAGYEVKF